jgi:hypothetical protein
VNAIRRTWVRRRIRLRPRVRCRVVDPSAGASSIGDDDVVDLVVRRAARAARVLRIDATLVIGNLPEGNLPEVVTRIRAALTTWAAAADAGAPGCGNGTATLGAALHQAHEGADETPVGSQFVSVEQSP